MKDGRMWEKRKWKQCRDSRQWVSVSESAERRLHEAVTVKTKLEQIS